MSSVQKLERLLNQARSNEAQNKRVAEIREQQRIAKVYEDRAIAEAIKDNQELQKLNGRVVENVSYDRHGDEITIQFVDGSKVSFTSGGGDYSAYLSWGISE